MNNLKTKKADWCFISPTFPHATLIEVVPSELPSAVVPRNDAFFKIGLPPVSTSWFSYAELASLGFVVPHVD